MKRYRLSVCKGPNCRQGGADQVFAACREMVAKAGLNARCEVYRGGCYGLCHLGPNVVVREDGGGPRDPLSREDFQLMGGPGEFHYAPMTARDIGRVVDEHLAQGRAVEELLFSPAGPANASKDRKTG